MIRSKCSECGQTIPLRRCSDCGDSIEGRGHNAVRCVTCVRQRAAQRMRERRAAERKMADRYLGDE